MNGKPSPLVTPLMISAMRMACSSLSITHGPAIRKRSPEPMWTSPTLKEVCIETNMYRGFSRICTDFFNLGLIRVDPRKSVALLFLDSYFFRPVEHLYRRRLLVGSPFRAMLIRRAYECMKQRMRLERLRLEFRMELAADKMRMVGQLHHLHVSSIGGRTGDAQSRRRQRPFILAVEFITMPVALADFGRPINPVRQRVWLDLARPRAKTHRAAKLFNAAQFAQFVDHPMRRCRIELARVCLGQSHHIARKLDASRLHAQANSEIWDFLFARITNRDQHAFDTSLAESARNQYPVIAFKLCFNALFVGTLQTFRFNPVQLQLQIVSQRPVD